MALFFLSRTQVILMLIDTREFFTFDFWKGAFIKLFVNPRFEREGDIHVWPDDHIDWSEIYAIFAEFGVTVEKQLDYLCYQPSPYLTSQINNHLKIICCVSKKSVWHYILKNRG